MSAGELGQATTVAIIVGVVLRAILNAALVRRARAKVHRELLLERYRLLVEP